MVLSIQNNNEDMIFDLLSLFIPGASELIPLANGHVQRYTLKERVAKSWRETVESSTLSATTSREARSGMGLGQLLCTPWTRTLLPVMKLMDVAVLLSTV